MSSTSLAIALHVATGGGWLLATLAIAIGGRARPSWLTGLLGIALLNMLVGIDLWHILHRGPWGAAEHLLVLGTFGALFAFGLQVPVALTLPRGARSLEGLSLAIIRVTAGVLIATAAAMLGSRWA